MCIPVWLQFWAGVPTPGFNSEVLLEKMKWTKQWENKSCLRQASHMMCYETRRGQSDRALLIYILYTFIDFQCGFLNCPLPNRRTLLTPTVSAEQRASQQDPPTLVRAYCCYCCCRSKLPSTSRLYVDRQGLSTQKNEKTGSQSADSLCSLQRAGLNRFIVNDPSLVAGRLRQRIKEPSPPSALHRVLHLVCFSVEV